MSWYKSDEKLRRSMIDRCIALGNTLEFKEAGHNATAKQEIWKGHFDFMYLKEHLLRRFEAQMREKREEYEAKVGTIVIRLIQHIIDCII